ncbi:hypothetical protein [Agromyces humi]|uniref:hypothetical protein n=1 Tax=Agromyces humi TaxID=1766800 RepID=UPI00135C7A73|nr:hypothetical protein [Agromyces humi]
MNDFDAEFGVTTEVQIPNDFANIDEEAFEMPAPFTREPRPEGMSDDRIHTGPISVSGSPREMALARLSNKDSFRDSEAQRAAAQLWATLEVAEATDRQTSAIERQTRALEEANRLTVLALAEQRKANQLSFFHMSPDQFVVRAAAPVVDADGGEHPALYTQVQLSLGIVGEQQ